VPELTIAVSPVLGGPEGDQFIATSPDPEPPNQVKVATASSPVSLTDVVLHSLDLLAQWRPDWQDQLNGRPESRSSTRNGASGGSAIAETGT
jgi:hypothetical protein